MSISDDYTVAQFVRFQAMADAGLSGCDYAINTRLPSIPERWHKPELRDAWITGYLTEIRNRLERDRPKMISPALFF